MPIFITLNYPAKSCYAVTWLSEASERLRVDAQLTDDAVRTYFAHFVSGEVERFEWPGLDGFNFLLHQALGGGGVASLRHDPQGKALAPVLMDFPVAVPAAWVAPAGPLATFAKGEAA